MKIYMVLHVSLQELVANHSYHKYDQLSILLVINDEEEAYKVEIILNSHIWWMRLEYIMNMKEYGESD